MIRKSLLSHARGKTKLAYTIAKALADGEGGHSPIVSWCDLIVNTLIVTLGVLMRRLTVAVGLGLASLAVHAVQIESDADIHERFQGDRDLINAAVGMVVGHGYRCDSLSTLYPFTFGQGFRVGCNNWSLFYELEDQGNNHWVVKRK